MKERLLKFIQENNLIGQGERVLLTVSGGIDSMTMLHLFMQTNIPFAVAHCNFQLREQDSFHDEQFVTDFAWQHHLEYYCKRFNTLQYCQENKLSVEMAARELRYKWFAEICQEHHFQLIATAHHLDDAIETFFLNAIRKTGIGGLHGIAPKSGNIIRPLLFCYRTDIQQYAEKEQLTYCEDKTNQDDAYTRNFIRLNIIPQFEQLRPDFKQNMTGTIQIVASQHQLYKQHIADIRKKILQTIDNHYIINISQLLNLPNAATYLFELLSPFNINYAQSKNIFASLLQTEEKRFDTKHFIILKTRENIEIWHKQSYPYSTLIINSLDKNEFQQQHLDFQIVENKDITFENNPQTAYFDLDKIQFPLQIRSWQTGDFFYPVKGKGKKKLSDFFTDLKLNSIQKQDIKLLTNSQDEILWVIGKRSDDRFAVRKSTKKILIIKYL